MPLKLLQPRPAEPWPSPSAEQRAVLARVTALVGGAVDVRAPVPGAARALLVRGAPGSGRTTTALAAVTQEVGAGRVPVGRALLLAPTRRAASRLRDELSVRLGRTTGQPVVRTPSSVAFSVLRARAALLGEPAPTLISGPEQDLVLADLLAGHRAGEGVPVDWPSRVPHVALGTRAFRDELRDLLMRAAERGLRPPDLARLAEADGRPEWAAAARLYAEYLQVTALRTATPDMGARFDPAVVVDEAAEALQSWDEEVPSSARPGWDLVVVDDYQEATAATARLLHVLAEDGARLVLLADPDVAVQTFRGASPGLVDRASGPWAGELGAFGAREMELGPVWRHGPALRTVVQDVCQEIRGPGRRHRSAPAAASGASVQGAGTSDGPVPGAAALRGVVSGASAPAAAPVRVAVLRSPAQEAAYVAHLLRAAHLEDGVPWRSMAVIVRAGTQARDLRRSLVAAQVPVAVESQDLPLHAEPAVRPLLLALRCALDPGSTAAEDAARLLTSPLGALDSVGLRRLRRALRAEELAGGGHRTSDELLPELLTDPARAATLPAGVRRPVTGLARTLATGRDAFEAPGATTPEVLWSLWSAAGLSEGWRRSSLAGGPGGARADRDLDAVLALFEAAEQFTDRMPHASPTAFLDHLAAQSLRADSLAARSDADEAVAVVTAAGAAGREWDLVVVVGVQEGVWPDLRLRDSVLGAQRLVDLVAGRVQPAAGQDSPAAVAAAAREARAAVLDDELRAFTVAVSRARRRLVVTAVSDTDHQPSPFVDLVDPGPADGEPDHRRVEVPAGLELRSVVARCRAVLEASVEASADHPAAVLLARLAAAGVPGADPQEWYGAAELSTDRPLWASDEQVRLSPSTLETAGTCTLRWALEAAGGRAADSGEQSLGTLLHEIAAALPTGTQDELRAALEARWGELRLGEGWVGSSRRRRADAMVAQLAAYLKDSDEVVAVEQPFAVEVGRVVLRGSVDRLERAPDGRLRVVDLKTGRTPVTREAAARHAQLGAYQVAVESGAFDDVAEPPTGDASPVTRSAGAALVYIGTGSRAPATRDQPALAQDRDPGWARALVGDVADRVSSAVVTATVNDMCRVCPVRRSCPAQGEGRVVGA